MTRLLGTLAAAAALTFAAHAGEAEGTVRSVDPSTRTITLDDGQAFVAADSVQLDTVMTGSRVRITFDDATLNATAVEAL
jgi:Cu/Ag efflux protein CusF